MLIWRNEAYSGICKALSNHDDNSHHYPFDLNTRGRMVGGGYYDVYADMEVDKRTFCGGCVADSYCCESSIPVSQISLSKYNSKPLK